MNEVKRTSCKYFECNSIFNSFNLGNVHKFLLRWEEVNGENGNTLFYPEEIKNVSA